MNILDNELVRRYFWCNPGCESWESHYSHMAHRVLLAMQEPIRKGERYLYWSLDYPESWVEQTQTNDDDSFHPLKLRLPDRFQKRECECICHNTKENHNCCENMNKPQPEAQKCDCVGNSLGPNCKIHPQYDNPKDEVEEKCPICHRCGEPLDKPGIKEYETDKSGGSYVCIHKNNLEDDLETLVTNIWLCERKAGIKKLCEMIRAARAS